MRRYIFGSILRKLPLFIVLTVVLCSVAIFSSNDVGFIVSHPISNPQYSSGPTDAGFLALIIFFFIFMTFLPLFSMNYRYSLAKADLYKQAPYKKKSIRYAEHLSTLIIVLIGFTLACLLLVGLIAFRNGYARVNVNTASTDYIYEVITYNYVYYIPLYFLSVVLGTAQYFISYFLVSRSNCVRNSVLVLITGEFALMAFITILASFMNATSKTASFTYLCFTGASPALPIITLAEIFNRAIIYNENYFALLNEEADYFSTGVVLFLLISNFIIYFTVAILGVISFTKEADPSGEFAGKPNTKKPYQEIIFHVGFGLLGTFISAMVLRLNMLSYFLFLVLFLASYYPLYGTLIRNFKLKPWQIGIMAGVVLFVIIVSAFDNWVYDVYYYHEY